MANALFVGSFDPFTSGHLDTVARATKIFDKVIVGVATNTNKTSLFSAEEKVQLIEENVTRFDNVEVINHSEGLTIDLARKIDANVLLRGVRSVKDYEYEVDIAGMNRHQAPEIETLLMQSNEDYTFVSSSIIKETAKYGGNIKELVPENVERALKEKFNN